jgi:hypothetical protein
MLEAPTVEKEECISQGAHMTSIQPGWGSEGTYIEECTNCGTVEYGKY